MAENKYSNIGATPVSEITTGEREVPPMVPGSILQLDADISAFYLAWPDETLSQNTEALKRHIEVKRLMAGAEFVNTHVTLGDKCGRHAAANVQEYQGNRKHDDPEKRARVNEIRSWLETYITPHVNPMPQWTMEADDSMSIEQNACLAQGIPSKIMTKDKDLDMVPGNHISYDEYEEWCNFGYGKIWMDRSGKVAKLKGQGTSFFWAQLLMGDKADNIPGLPSLAGDMLNEYKPTKAITGAKATLSNAKATARARTAATKVLATRKAAPIGPALAFALLENVTDDMGALRRVRQAYQSHYGSGNFSFQTWRGDTIETNSSLMLLEQAKLLWMLRTPTDDALDFMKEIG